MPKNPPLHTHLVALAKPVAQLVQRQLSALGYYQGTFGGSPGPKTDAAYRLYLGAAAVDEPPPAEQTIPQQLLEILRAEIGVREEPRNSNRGRRVEEYQAATWLDGTGWPWCAALICWGILQVSKKRGHQLPFERPLTAGAWDFERWARSQNLHLLADPTAFDLQPGDIVVFDISHIGVFDRIDDNDEVYCFTIEGNTDQSPRAGGVNREGGGVYRARRRITDFRSRIRLPEG